MKRGLGFKKMFPLMRGNSRGCLFENSIYKSTHPNLPSQGKEFTAFTLAEVLITLAIIGVVAVLTVPNLVQEYKKRAIVSQLQRTIALLDTGFRKMVADDGVDYIFQTKLWSYGGQLQGRPVFGNYFKSEYTGNNDILRNYTLTYVERFNTVCQEWEYTPESPYVKQCTGGYVDESRGFFAEAIAGLPQETAGAPGILANGVFIWSGAASSNGLSARIYVDVNGKQGPNQYGYDIHKLGLTNEGHVIPMNINGEDEYDLEGGTIGAKRIKDDGWKMKY